MMTQTIRKYMATRSHQGLCPPCGKVVTLEEVEAEIPVTNGVVVEGVPAGRCPGCGRIYHDVFLNELVEEAALDHPAGRIQFAHLLMGTQP